MGRYKKLTMCAVLFFSVSAQIHALNIPGLDTTKHALTNIKNHSHNLYCKATHLGKSSLTGVYKKTSKVLGTAKQYLLWPQKIFSQKASAVRRDLARTTSRAQGQEFACFFLSNGGIYYSGDPVTESFIEALIDKQSHIFVSYPLWQHYLVNRKEIKEAFRRIGIMQPEEQIYICGKADPHLMPGDIINQLWHNGVESFDALGIKNIQEATNKYGITSFYGPSHDELCKRNIKPTLDNFKKHICGVIDPYGCNVLGWLIGFIPDEWEVYDTGLGLYYLRPKKNSTNNGINVDNFTRIKNPLLHTIKPHEENAWTKHMDKIFAQGDTYWSFYFAGHGQPMRDDYSPDNHIAATPNKAFAQILAYLHHNLHTQRIAIISCYTPPQRALNLVKKYHNIPKLNYDIICAVSSDVVAYGNLSTIYIQRYVPKNLANTDCIIEKKCETTSMYDVIMQADKIPKEKEKTEQDIELEKILHSRPPGENNPTAIYANTTAPVA